MVASHTAAPLGAAKWLVRATPHTRNLAVGKGQEQHMSPTQGQAYIIGATPHQPFRRTHRHGCMAGYLSPMPIGIFLADRYLYSAQRHLLCDCASTILFLLLYSFVNVYYLSLVSAKNAEGMKRIQAGGEVRSTEPLLRVRRCISSEGTTESLSPLWGSFLSRLPYRGSASLHHLPIILLPFGDYAVMNA